MEKVQKQATTFFKEFQAFISKGNVVDLAVAVIVGAAFNNIISSLVKDIINPILGALIGKPDFTNLFWVMKMPADYTGPMTYDALTMDFRKVKLPHNTDNCPVCGKHPTITKLIDYEQAECDGIGL